MTMTLVPLRADTLAARLQELGVATSQQLEQAKQELARSQERFSAVLVRQGLLKDAEAGKRFASQLGCVPQRVDGPSQAVSVGQDVPATVWRSQHLAPVRDEGDVLLLATDDPLTVFALEFWSRRWNRRLELVLVREAEFTQLLETAEGHRVSGTAPGGRTVHVHEPPETPAPAPTTPKPAPTRKPAPPPTPAQPPRPTIPPRAAPGVGARRAPPPAAPQPPTPGAASSAPAAASGDEPIIRLVDSMLSEAVRMRGSDVHLEPSRGGLRVRYRIDGVLHDVNTPPKALHGPIVSRIKILGGLNIAEKRLPQDGRLQVNVEDRPMDVRISTLPSMHGESIVMRLLDRSQPIRGFADMGLLSEDQQVWEQAIHRPHGMVLVTGPTGSGKTTTLYAALSALNESDRKLITVEDPVEYQLNGVNQVAVRAGIGLTFAAGLRSMLRQAPDVIMVGEIRDQETAQVAVQAALTGHLVLSTLHTNDAPSTITRLVDMGVAPFLVASTVQAVLAQRLIRRICPDCRVTENATAEERAFLGPPEVEQVVRSNGCEACHGSGYRGRVGLFELLTITDAVRKLIVAKASAADIRAQAVADGMRALRADGVAKIREGTTTLAEVLRVIAEA